MTKTEFLKALEEGLAGASAEERGAALQYFSEYLDDAGPEREAEVLAELGDPQKVAADILSASGSAGADSTENTAAEDKTDKGAAPAGEKPSEEPMAPWLSAVVNVLSGLGQPPKTPGPDDIYPPPPDAPPPPGSPRQEATDSTGQPEEGPDGTRTPVTTPAAGGASPYDSKNTRVAVIILLALAAIFVISIIFSPVTGGILTALFWAAVALLCVFLVPFFAGIGLTVGGIIALVMGCLLIGVNLASGMVAIGLSVCIIGLGLLCLYGGTHLMAKTLPKAFQAAGQGIKWLAGKVSGFFNRFLNK